MQVRACVIKVAFCLFVCGYTQCRFSSTYDILLCCMHLYTHYFLPLLKSARIVCKVNTKNRLSKIDGQ